MKTRIMVFITSLFIISNTWAEMPTNIQEYSNDGITKEMSDDGNLSIPVEYVAYLWGSYNKNNNQYCCIKLLSPSGNTYVIAAHSANANFFKKQSSAFYNHYVQNGSYYFMNLQAVEQGIWTLVLVQSNAGSWFYYRAPDSIEEQNPKNDSIMALYNVETLLIDSTSQPMIVGGYISNYSSTDISKKGIIVGKEEAEMAITNSTPFEQVNYNTASASTMNYNTRFIDCSNIGKEEYIIYLRFLEGNQRYFIRAFAIHKDGCVIYGDIKEVATQDFIRNKNKDSDKANVWYLGNNSDKNLYSLFDLVTDEIIDPQNGFYYSTNENPAIVNYQIGTSYNTCYKFLTEWNYKLWYYHNTIHCDQNKIVSLPQMSYSGGKISISASETDVNKELTFYYSIDTLGNRPEKFTSIYTEPISVNVNSVVYCYAISSDGYISYTNAYKVVKNDTLNDDIASSLDKTNDFQKPNKIMIDGQIFILRGDNTYTITGSKVQ